MNVSLMSGAVATRSLFRPDIEGLRAIAILLVVGYHIGIPSLSGGYVGVDIFFVVSGYLITGLLVREMEQTGRIGLLRFYARRARRLLPALALVLLATIILGAVIYPPFEVEGGRFAVTAATTAVYASNMYFLRTSTDYFGPTRENNPFLHTWSLSVEEQFYFVWPLFIAFALGAFSLKGASTVRYRRLLWWLTVAAGLSFTLSLYLTKVLPSWAYFLSPARAWEFALGALALLLPQQARFFSSPTMSKVAPYTAWAGLLGICFAAVAFNGKTPFPGFAALLPGLSTAIVLWAAASIPDNLVVRGLSLGPLQQIGQLSYSWYLWHWPVLVLASAAMGPLSLMLRSGLGVVALGLSVVSYRMVENPIRYNQRLARRDIYSLAMAVVLAVFGIVISFTWRQMSLRAEAQPQQVRFTRARQDRSAFSRICQLNYLDVQIKDCTYGGKGADVSIVLLGDSHAAQWFPALERIAVKRNWRLLGMTKSACAMVDAEFFLDLLGRMYGECDEWRRNALEEIRKTRPLLTVMASSEEYAFQDAEWRDGISKVVRTLAESSQNVLVLRDNPYADFDVPSCLARRAWRPTFMPAPPCDFPVNLKSNVYGYQRQAVLPYPNVALVDLSSSICPDAVCRVEREGLILFRDSNHLTASFVNTLQERLSEEIDKVLMRHVTSDVSSAR